MSAILAGEHQINQSPSTIASSTLGAMNVRVRQLDCSDESDLEAYYRIELAVNDVDLPGTPTSRLDTVGRLRYDWPSSVATHWLAYLDDVPVGRLSVDLHQLDNRHLANVNVVVHPDHRRRGVGRTLYDTGVAFVRADGRTVIQGEYVTALTGQGPDGGLVGEPRGEQNALFAAAVGAKDALPEVRRRLDLTTVDRDAWGPLFDDARRHAEGYSTVVWRDTTPDDIVDDVAMLEGRMIIDAPMGDLILEQEKIDAARIWAMEHTHRLRGRRMYHAGARHDATGRLAAWTLVGFDGDVDHHAWQQITIVDPAHRGHRLGMLVKLANLTYVLANEPQLRTLDTWNATVNDHMISINEAIGFRAYDGWVSWQAEI